MSDTPPKINRTICLTFIPYLMATTECINSWRNTETNKMTAPAAPIIQYCAVVRLGKYCGIKLLARVHAIKKNTMTSVKCSRTGIP